MKILLDMNLPSAWVDFLENEGFQTVHWANVGPYDASDKEIMTWAKEQSYVVFRHYAVKKNRDLSRSSPMICSL
jgi:predicted nuclease of predicted toxin-antitoxin system